MRLMVLVWVGGLSLGALAGCQDGGKGNYAMVAGTYSCLSYSVDAQTGQGVTGCTSQPWLYLELDGTYTFSSSEGTYTYRDETITFTGDLGDRPPAEFNADKQITWTFVREDKLFTIVYFQREARVSDSEPDGPNLEDNDRVAGEYLCDLGTGCSSVNALVLDRDGTWYWETSVGEYEMEGDSVVFSSPYEGWGPDGWGACDHDDGTLTFRQGGVESVWVRQG